MSEVTYNQLHGVEVTIGGNLLQVQQALKHAENDVKNTVNRWTQEFNKVVTATKKVHDATVAVADPLRRLSGLVVGAFAVSKIYGFLRDITYLAARVEVLEVVSEQVGKTAGYSAEEVRKYTKAVENLGITQIVANEATTRFIQAGLDLRQVAKVARVAQDAAVIANQNSSETLQGMIHGIVTLMPRVLRTYGIIVDLERAYARYGKAQGKSAEQITSQEKQQIALNEVLVAGSRITGTYEASMTKAGKQLTSLERYQEEFKVQLGTHLQKAFSLIIVSLTQFYKEGMKNADLNQVFETLGRSLGRVVGFVVQIVTWLVKHPKAIENFFVYAVVVRFTSALYKGVVAWGLTALTADKAAMSALRYKATVGGLILVASALGLMLGEKIPKAVHIGILAFTAISAAVLLLTRRFDLLWLKLGPIGWAVIAFTSIFSIVGLTSSAMEDFTSSAESATDQERELREEASRGEESFRTFREQALNLARQYITLYEEGRKTAEGQKQLGELLSDLTRLVPDLVGGVDNLDEAYTRLKNTIADLDKEVSSFTVADLEKEAAGLEGVLLQPFKDIPAGTRRAQKTIGEFTDWLSARIGDTVEAPQYSQLIETLASSNIDTAKAALDEFQLEYGNTIKRLREVQRGILSSPGADVEDLKTMQEAIKYWSDLQKFAEDTYKKREKLLAIEKSISEIEAKGMPKPPVEKRSPIDPKILDKAREMSWELQIAITKDEGEQERIRILQWASEQDAKIKELRKGGLIKEAEKLQGQVNTAVSVMNDQAAEKERETERKNRESQLRNRAEVSRSALEDQRKYLQEQLKWVDRTTKEGENRYWEYAAQLVSIERQITEGLREENSKRIEMWEQENSLKINNLQAVRSVYMDTVQSFGDIEMTGKERRERIWRSFTNAILSRLAEETAAYLFSTEVRENADRRGVITKQLTSILRLHSIRQETAATMSSTAAQVGKTAADAGGVAITPAVIGAAIGRTGATTAETTADQASTVAKKSKLAVMGAEAGMGVLGWLTLPLAFLGIPFGIFHSGGYVQASGEKVIKVTDGEYVVNPHGTAINRPALEYINSGADIMSSVRRQIAVSMGETYRIQRNSQDSSLLVVREIRNLRSDLKNQPETHVRISERATAEGLSITTEVGKRKRNSRKLAG